MKLLLSLVASVLCVFFVLFANSADFENLSILSRLFLKLFLILSFYYAGKVRFTKTLVLFLGLIFVSDTVALFALNLDFDIGYLQAVGSFMMYCFLLKEAWGHFKMNHINYSLSYLLGILTLFVFVLLLHLRVLLTSFENVTVMIVGHIIYLVALLAIAAVSLSYYFNSYSTKSMHFLVASVTFLCSDLVYCGYYFYNVTEEILGLGVVLSAAGYVFILNYFATKEEPLLLESDMIEEIKEIRRRIELDLK